MDSKDNDIYKTVYDHLSILCDTFKKRYPEFATSQEKFRIGLTILPYD